MAETTPPVAALDPRGASTDTASLLSRLPDVAAWTLNVVEVMELTPSMRRIRLHGDRIDQLHYDAGQDLMLAVPDGTGVLFRRRYTIRRFDRAAGLLDIDMVLHGDGPGARWAASASSGDQMEVVGPRGKITLDPDADWHLFAGDESGLPATFAMVEALEEGGVALSVAEVAGPAEEQHPEPAEGVEVSLRWLHRGPIEPGTDQLLVPALEQLELPDGRGHAYLTGELRVVAAMRKALEARGLTAEQLSPKPYWRRGVANAAHGEPLKD